MAPQRAPGRSANGGLVSAHPEHSKTDDTGSTTGAVTRAEAARLIDAKGGVMTRPVYVEKTVLVAMLRSRELHARAQWVDRELPGLVDTYKNAVLLQMLGIDPDAMSPVNATPPE